MTIAIAGATGLTGSICLQYLLQHSQVQQVISIGRRPCGVSHAKLQEIVLHDGHLHESISADAFICCLGTTIKKAGTPKAFQEADWHLPVRIARSLFESGCQCASVISAMGANIDSRFIYNRTKGQMEAEMKNIGFRSLNIFRPSIITGQREEKRSLERLAIGLVKIINPLLLGSLKHYRTIAAKDIAMALIQSVLSIKPGCRIYLSDEIKTMARN